MLHAVQLSMITVPYWWRGFLLHF